MTPKKVRALRLKLRDELWKCFPKADAAQVHQAVNLVLPLIMRESFNLVEMEHDRDCTCWPCLHALHAEIVEHHARMRVAREAAEEHD